MPLYDYSCPDCARRATVFLRLADLNKPQECPSCLCRMERQISAVMVRGEISPYISPTTGKVISSRNQARDDLKASGCVVLEKGAQKQIEANREAHREAHYKKVDSIVDKVAGELAASGKI